MANRLKRFLRGTDDEALKKKRLLRKDEKDTGDEDEGGSGRSGRGGRKPPWESYLGEDTPERENARRKIEITGLIATTGLASEARRDRDAPRKDASYDEGLEGAPEHPILGDKQQYDGLEPDVNPLPDLTSPEGREEYQLEQQLKMQKRQELQDRLTNKPEFKPPGL